MDGIILALIFASCGLLPKACLEAFYFHDKKAARRTILSLLVALGTLLVAFGFSLFFNYFC